MGKVVLGCGDGMGMRTVISGTGVGMGTVSVGMGIKFQKLRGWG